MNHCLRTFFVRHSLWLLAISLVLTGVSASPAHAAFPVKVKNASGTGTVNAVAVLSSGNIVIGGDFTQIYNGVPPGNSSATARSYLALLDSTGQPLPTTFAGLDASANVLAVQSNGDIIAAGDFAGKVARFTQAGIRDAAFTPTVTSGNVTSVAIQPVDGKILVAGDEGGGPYLARFNADGTQDSGFDVSIAGSVVSAVVVQGDGKILIGGQFTSVGGSPRSNIARLNSDGTLDTSFNPQVDAAVRSIAVQSSDNRVVIGGAFLNVGGTGRAGVARLNTDGTVDTSFSPGSGANGSIDRVAVQGTSIFVAGLFSSYAGTPRNRIARLNSDGSLDSGFVPPSTASSAFIQAIGVQSDGKVLLGGYFPGNIDTYQLIRLATDGSSEAAPATSTAVTLGSIPAVTYGASVVQLTVTTVAGATGVVSVSSSNPAVAAVTHDAVAGTWSVAYAGAGTATVTAYLTGSFDPAQSSQTVTVSKKSLTVTAENKSRPTGQANPAFTYTIAGFVNGDSAAVVSGTPTLSTTATPGSAAGTYPINVDVGPLSAANYSFSGVAGTLTVTSTSSVAFSSAAYVGTEDAGKADVTLVRSGVTSVPLTAKVTFPGGGTATSADYVGAGTLDNGYSTPSLSSYVYTLLLQADGKTLLGGRFANKMIRLNVDGSQDSSFTPATFASSSFESPRSLAQQADGKIIVGGSFTTLNGAAHSCIGRLNSNGTLDSAFTSTGAASPFPFVYAVAVQPSDQKILAAGSFTSFNGTTAYNLARLNSNGSLDSTFNVSVSKGSPATDTVNVYALAVQSDGKILIGGDFTNVNGTVINRIARVTSSGTLDTSFAVGAGFSGTSVNSIVVQSDGKILVGGLFTAYNGTPATNMIRLNADGSIDSGFISPAAANASVRGLSVQPDGSIVVGGDFSGGLIRVTATGAADTSFANPGISGTVNGLALQSDGKIIAGGNFTVSSRTNIARFTGDLFVTWAANDTTSKTVSIPLKSQSGTQGLRTLNLGLAAFPISYATVATPSSAVVSIYDQSQTITFGPLTPVVYGAVPFSPASATSALPITYSSSDTTVATGGSTITIKKVGTTTITASQPGSGGYAPATSVAQSLTVGKAQLTVSTAPAIRSYGAANPTFAPTYSGFVYTDTAAVLLGTPSLTTSATTNSPPGDYPITVAAGSLAATNYSFSFVNGTLTVAPLPSATITPGFSSPTASSSASFTIGGTGVIAYKYQVDGTGYSGEIAVATPISLTSLGEGSHTLSVIGKNSAGDWQVTPATFTWSVDRTPPTLTLSALPDQALTGDDTVNVAGIASDANGVGNVTINGAAVTLNADGSFSYPVPLTLNQNNVITTVATDRIGNQVTDVRTIINGAAPQLAVTSPSDNSSTVESFVTVSGTVSDAGATITALREGDSAGTTASGPSFGIPVNLQPGINTIIITATYPGGSTATAKRTVSRTTSGPSVAISGPSQDVTTTNPGIIVQGTLADANSPSVSVTLDGHTYSPQISGGAFSQSIAFSAEKTYDIVVAVTDGSATTTVQRNVIYHLPSFAGPTIKIGSASGLRTKTVSVPVTLKNVAGTSLVSAAVEIGYDPGALQSPTIVAGTAATAAGKSVTATSPTPGVYQISVSGFNSNIIGDGTLATVTFTVASSAPYAATSLVDISSATDGSGNGVSTLGVNGIIHVITKPGDASGDGTVSIGEVQSAINMFLGTKSTTFYADLNGDGSVSIGEVQKAINAFLGL